MAREEEVSGLFALPVTPGVSGIGLAFPLLAEVEPFPSRRFHREQGHRGRKVEQMKGAVKEQ
jgi:hypothetical protein